MPVARHRARRFAGRDVHDVTCSVGVDLAALAAVADRCVGSDVDEVRLLMAAAQHVGTPVLRADALRPVTRDTAVFVDPARRDAAGRRRWHAADFVPPLDELADAYRGRDLAVKCAPGMDFAELPWSGEVELVSLDGQVREACLWTGAFAGPSRRATVLRTDGPRVDGHLGRAGRLPGPCSGGVAGRPGRRGRAGGPGPPVRGDAGFRPAGRTHRLPDGGHEAARGPRVPGAGARPLQREVAAPDPPPPRRGPTWRSWCAAWTWTRTRCAPD